MIFVAALARFAVGVSWAASTQGPFSVKAEFAPRGDGPLFVVMLPSGCSKTTCTAMLRGAYAALAHLSTMATAAAPPPSTPEGSPFPPLMELVRHVCVTLTINLKDLKPQGPSIGLASALAVLSLLYQKPLFNRVVTGIVSPTAHDDDTRYSMKRTLILWCLVKLRRVSVAQDESN